ncbi:hypothetical protein LJR219_004713 [Phenylobacterium sp. LjRoot219]|uniref:hypothetical protein n=1 Tax=Phenylobacterium sp. LjRoot219 TaxID=3342283 RepID=UPI003ECD76EF
MKLRSLTVRVCLIATSAVAAFFTHSAVAAPRAPAAASTGRYEIYTLPLADGFVPRSAMYTPSGRVLVSSTQEGEQDQRQVTLVVMDDDGRNARTIFSQAVPPRPKDKRRARARATPSALAEIADADQG